MRAFEDIKRDNFIVEGQYSLANTVPLTEVFNVAPALTRRWQPNHNSALFILSVCITTQHIYNI